MRTPPRLDDSLSAIARFFVILVIPTILLIAARVRGDADGGAEPLLLAFTTGWGALLLVALVDRATAGFDREVGVVARIAAPFLLTLAPAAIIGWLLLAGVHFPDGVGVVILLAEIGGFLGVLACLMLHSTDPS